jgi:hypothetical protein
MAATYHHRVANPGSVLPDSITNGQTFGEHRFALDTKFDLLVGLWFEAAVIHQDMDFTELRYKSLLNAGMDYTFDLGNGLNIMAETFGSLQGDKLLGAEEKVFLGLVSATYPLNIIHNVSAMLFYDFSNKEIYRFVNWTMTYDRWSFYLMGFWNPGTSNLYNFKTETNLYSGWGFQVMAVFNH